MDLVWDRLVIFDSYTWNLPLYLGTFEIAAHKLVSLDFIYIILDHSFT
jgi:multisubunit Na+/H+ antiporter MnhF subunit